MRKIIGKVAPTAAAVAVATVLSAAGGAYAATQISGAQIKNNTVSSADIENNSIKKTDLASGLKYEVDKANTSVQPGTLGNYAKKSDVSGMAKSGLDGAVYRVENYKNGGGGDASVACADDEATSQKYTAIAGGVNAGHVQVVPGQDNEPNTFAVTASFPGRMDWSTGQPKTKADGSPRLDGWIILGNGQQTPNLKVWALCVPNTDIQVQQVDLDN